MRKYSFLLLIVLCLLSACGSRTPNSVYVGAVSTKTGIENDWGIFTSPGGFQESRLIRWRSIKWVDSLHYTKKESKVIGKETSAAMNRIIVDPLPEGMPYNYAPGGVFITPLQLYFDETEVANIHWQEFLNYAKRDSSASFYQNMLPDSTVIKLNNKDHLYIEPWGYHVLGGDTTWYEWPVFSEYFRHPEYLFYPIVGVSYEQAVAYCQWRSKVVTKQYNDNPKNEQKLKITYRLPTEQEWEVIAAAGYDKEKFPYSAASNGYLEYKLNPKAAAFLAKKIVDPKPVALIEQDLKQTKVQSLPLHVKQSLPYFLQFRTPIYVYDLRSLSNYGAYHVQGNVAEMVAEKGIAKGGSWKDELSNSKITDRQYYTSPSDKVGFRCVCEAELLK